MTHTMAAAVLVSVSAALRRLVVPIVVGVAMVAATQVASAQKVERSGKEVFETSCFACHGSGAGGAPKIGDKQAWAKRTAQGLTSLTASALKGIRQMPPHGGNPALTDTEIERAITYMVNQSGGNWTEPISRTARTPDRTGEEIVQARCIKCHQTGEGGAPKIGDRAAWVPRVKQGLDVVVRSAIKGHGGMPARGGQADLTDAEMRSAVLYMFSEGSAPPPSAASPTSAGPQVRAEGLHRVVGETAIDLGVVAAETIRAAHPKPDAESTMHGGIPSGKGYYHVNVSLRDVTSGAAIEDAEVQVRVANPSTGSETKKLEPMAIRNTLNYGNYFRMPAKDPYSITVDIRRPGRPQGVEAKFAFRHD